MNPFLMAHYKISPEERRRIGVTEKLIRLSVGIEDQEDLISIGTIGLIKAIESFSEGKGTKLATYAARCIENEILMHLRALKKDEERCFVT